MILELEDITEREPVVAHLNLPAGTPLSEIFDRDKRIEKLKDYVVKCSVNGAEISEWRSATPGKNDRVKIYFRPGFAAIIAILGTTLFTVGTTAVTVGMVISAISTLVSLASFFIQLFSSGPKAPTASGGPSRQKYSFEGLKTAISPGNPISVTYGQERLGGQLLMLDLSVAQNNKRQEMSMLVGVGEGPITEVNCFRVNDIDLTTIGGSVSTDFRLGQTSQSIIPGFERIRNTFADGREITGTPGSANIVYSTAGNSVVGIELQITAAEGLIHRDSDGTENSNWDEYSVENRVTGTTTYSFLDNRKRFSGKSNAPIWQMFASSISPAEAHDIRIVYLRGAHAGNHVAGAVKARGRLWLSNVTEIQGAGEPYSGTALVAFKAIATKHFHGGPPQLSILVRGRSVKVFSSTAVSTVTWSQNPAWCLMDYMTNSIYGMGPYLSESDLNIQSFLDFAVLCNSLVPDGKGGLERQHQLDLVMDQQKAHWQWVNDILGLYRSGIIYSQQKWKIISDRQDLPIRQVFHSGNIIKGTMEVKIGGDPYRPNQANVTFSNKDLDYTQDILFVQNSASIAANEPIKPYDLNYTGITRPSEAARNSGFDLERRRQIRREISFATGIEALAVEPGDHCRAGILMTDWEAGYGGRALDGSSRHIVLDREVVVRSGYAYDLFVWHVAADTVEQRTVATTVPTGVSCFTTITVSPTAAFSYAVMPNDRWAIGITSEDLFRAIVKRVGRDELGRHALVVEEYRTVVPTTPQPRQAGLAAPSLLHPPAQPMGVVITEGRPEFRDGTITGQLIVDVSPAPLVEGGRITVPGTTASVTLATSHNPTSGALVGEELYFTSGPASGGTYLITAWGGGGTRVATVTPTFASPPDSGDPYNLYKLRGEFGSFEFNLMRSFPNSESELGLTGTYMGTRAEVPLMPQGGETTNFVAEVVPISTDGIRNARGTWVLSFTTFGDTTPPPMPGSLFIQRVPVGAPTIQVIPTSYGDLWGHNFYRHTANCFTNATTIGFGTTNYQDAGVSYATTYFYWAAPVDFSLNVGSYIGPITHVQSFVITSDIDSNAVSNIIEFQGSTFATSRTLTDPFSVAFATIITQGGPVLISAGFSTFSQLPKRATLSWQGRLAVDSSGHALEDRVYQWSGHNTGINDDAFLNGPQGVPFSFSYLDATSLGTHTYYLFFASPDSVQCYDISLQLVELKR